jgi:hypothetical protein
MAEGKGGAIDTIIDGIAGTIGGWWSRRAVSEAASNFSDDEDSYYRDRYESSPRRLADRSYEEVRPAYQIGHLARNNPDYQSRDFESIEPELRAGWADTVSSRHGDWSQVREYARDAYTQDFSVAAREAAVRNQAPGDNLGDRLVNSDRPRANRVAGAIDDDGRDDKGDDGNAEARLELPVSRR